MQKNSMVNTILNTPPWLILCVPSMGVLIAACIDYHSAAPNHLGSFDSCIGLLRHPVCNVSVYLELVLPGALTQQTGSNFSDSS